jgi:hypothetical protein
VTVAGTIAYVAKQCSGGLHGRGKRDEGEKSEQPKGVLQGGIVTDIQA